MVIEGKLHVKFDTQQVGQTMTKRNFVLEFSENPLYPQFVSFELVKDRCSLIDPFNVGDVLEVTFNLRGREWTTPDGEKKYFNSLEAWMVKKKEGEPNASSGGNTGGSSAAQKSAATNSASNDLGIEDPSDDLPF